MTPAIREQLESARAGKPAKVRPRDLIGADGKLDPAGLEILAAGIEAVGEPGRAQVLQLLVDAARRADPLFAIGGNLIRDARVVDLLTGPALLRRDPVRTDALDALLA